METCVLLSIRPEYAERILNGTKKYELRRKIFNNRAVNRIIVYATSPVKQVVGEFEIDEIIETDVDELWNRTAHSSGVDKIFFEAYFSGLSEGYAIKIKRATRYRHPMNLDDDFDIAYPPQFFMYLRELPECIHYPQ